MTARTWTFPESQYMATRISSVECDWLENATSLFSWIYNVAMKWRKPKANVVNPYQFYKEQLCILVRRHPVLKNFLKGTFMSCQAYHLGPVPATPLRTPWRPRQRFLDPFLTASPRNCCRAKQSWTVHYTLVAWAKRRQQVIFIFNIDFSSSMSDAFKILYCTTEKWNLEEGPPNLEACVPTRLKCDTQCGPKKATGQFTAGQSALVWDM